MLNIAQILNIRQIFLNLHCKLTFLNKSRQSFKLSIKLICNRRCAYKNLLISIFTKIGGFQTLGIIRPSYYGCLKLCFMPVPMQQKDFEYLLNLINLSAFSKNGRFTPESMSTVHLSYIVICFNVCEHRLLFTAKLVHCPTRGNIENDWTHNYKKIDDKQQV